jgi:hypothetical protein
VCIYNIFFIHSFVDGHLGWFHNLAIMNNAAVKMGMQLSLQQTNFDSFKYTLRSGIAGS